MNDLSIIHRNLSDLISLSDEEAAPAMHERIIVLDKIKTYYERSYAERGIIAAQFEDRHLWIHLIDPITGEAFRHFTAWMHCREYLGGARTNFEAYGDIKLLADVHQVKLIEVPKRNIKLLTGLSTEVRNAPDVLAAAKTLSREQFEEKIEKEYPLQHIERRQTMRFNPERSGAKVVEEWLSWAWEHEGMTRDEAFVRACEMAMMEAKEHAAKCALYADDYEMPVTRDATT